MTRHARSLLTLCSAVTLVAGHSEPLHAADAEIALSIKDHRFEPAELRVPSGQRLKLVIHNQDGTPEEFESHALNREKLIPAGAKAAIFVGPLEPAAIHSSASTTPTAHKR